MVLTDSSRLVVCPRSLVPMCGLRLWTAIISTIALLYNLANFRTPLNLSRSLVGFGQTRVKFLNLLRFRGVD